MKKKQNNFSSIKTTSSNSVPKTIVPSTPSQSTHISSSNTISSNNQIHNKINFPIWEKIYLEMNEETKNFFDNFESILISKEIYLFPKYFSENNKFYAIFNIKKEEIKFYNLKFKCFHPILILNKNVIYLYSYDNSYNSDFRYNLIEFDINLKNFEIIQYKGVAPKVRENFISFYLKDKIYFFGGEQKFIGDISLNYLFSFDIIEQQWNIENNYNNQIYLNETSNFNYISNSFDVKVININDDKVFLIGGKYYDDIFYNSNVKIGAKTINEIIEFSIIIKENSNYINLEKKKIFKELFQNENFMLNNFSCYLSNNFIYIFNYENLYCLDYENNNFYMIKPKLFEPKLKKNSNLIIYDSKIYLFGIFNCYEDCFLFKSELENIKWKSENVISYENLLNIKECSDMICSFNNGDSTKEIYLNKKILYNFSSALKILINSKTQNSKSFYLFNDINFNPIFNLLKFIYSNFNYDINNIEIDIINEIVIILLNYKAKSILNILISYLNLTNDKVIIYYEIAKKNNLIEFQKRCENYINTNINNIKFNESFELKKLIYEQYFCEHKVYIQCNVMGLEIKNFGQETINEYKINELKELNKNGKLNYCLNCNKVFKPFN